MPSAPIVTWARIFPLLAAVTPRSRYLKKERRAGTRGAGGGGAAARLPRGGAAGGRAPAAVAGIKDGGAARHQGGGGRRRVRQLARGGHGCRLSDRRARVIHQGGLLC